MDSSKQESVTSAPLPEPGSEAERARYLELQARLPNLFRDVYQDRAAARTVVVIPGLSLDQETLSKVSGVSHYEERQLSMLMLLRMPNTHVVFVTSTPLNPVVIDYYLNLLSGVPNRHASERLTLLSAYDGSAESLTRKILKRPRLMARIAAAIREPAHSHMSCFNATGDEVTLAVRLGIPLYACDPALSRLGTKSGSREAFRAAGVSLPDGAEGLRSREELAEALVALKQRSPEVRKVVVKLEEGFSGDGNALFRFAPDAAECDAAGMLDALKEGLEPEAEGLDAKRYLERFDHMGGIVECWVEGEHKTSPSVQMRINPMGGLELISTHDQVLGGRSGQIFLGSTFPAHPEYRLSLQQAGRRIGEVLRQKGVLGRFAVDFVSVRENDDWRHFAIEINLRKGGTTLPYQMLQFLTDGRYQESAGCFLTPMGQERCYYATDNLCQPHYRRLIPEDLMDILVAHRLHFDETRQRGVVFNLIGALSEFGKLGLVCIADTPANALRLYQDTVEVIDREAERVSF